MRNDGAKGVCVRQWREREKSGVTERLVGIFKQRARFLEKPVRRWRCEGTQESHNSATAIADLFH